MVAVKDRPSVDIFDTPWGWVGAERSARGLRRLVLPRDDREDVEWELGLPAGARIVPWPELRAGVRRFFSGTGPCPEVPVDVTAARGFTRRVLEAARAIPPGSTVTYGQLARLAGNPRAARAAGQVMARNRLPLVIPCHRVVAASGPGGYAGGPGMKARLLLLERSHAAVMPGGMAARRA